MASRLPGITCAYSNTGAFSVDNGTTCRQASTPPGISASGDIHVGQALKSSSKQTKPPLFGPKVDFSVRDRYNIKDGNSYYGHADNFDRAVAHHYLAINSLGVTNLTPVQIMTRLKLDWDKVFPFGAKGQDGTNRVHVGQIFELGGLRVTSKDVNVMVPLIGDLHFKLPEPGWGNFVEVTHMTQNTVTVETLAMHTFTGLVENGIFRDKFDELWMYQMGTGLDSPGQRLLNYASAPFLWSDAAVRVQKLIGSKRVNVGEKPVMPPPRHLP